jgi:hypothetical protein
MSRENLTDEQRKKISNDSYRIAMLDLAQDSSKDAMFDLEMILKDLESKEMYEECSGILRAMETYGFIKNFYLITEKNNLSDKIQLDYDNNDTAS